MPRTAVAQLLRRLVRFPRTRAACDVLFACMHAQHPMRCWIRVLVGGRNAQLWGFPLPQTPGAEPPQIFRGAAAFEEVEVVYLMTDLCVPDDSSTTFVRRVLLESICGTGQPAPGWWSRRPDQQERIERLTHPHQGRRARPHAVLCARAHKALRRTPYLQHVPLVPAQTQRLRSLQDLQHLRGMTQPRVPQGGRVGWWCGGCGSGGGKQVCESVSACRTPAGMRP